jgi:four helix bundle protein
MNQSAQPATDRVTTTSCNNGGGAGRGEGQGWGNGVERLAGYRLALELAAAAPALVPRGHAALKDQIDRASASVVLTLAEGRGRWQAREKAHYYCISRGSVVEVRACIDVIEARGLASAESCAAVRALAERVARILTGLIRSIERRGRG